MEEECCGTKGEREKKELGYIIYVCQFPTRNVIIMHYEHLLVKIKNYWKKYALHVLTKFAFLLSLLHSHSPLGNSKRRLPVFPRLF